MATESSDSTQLTGAAALARGAALLEAEQMAELWGNEVKRIQDREGLGPKWMPLLSTYEEAAAGPGVQFVNFADPREERWVTLNDPELKEFKDYLDARFAAVKNIYNLEGGVFVPKEEEGPDGDAVDGLNAMYIVQTLINHFTGQNDDPGSGISNESLAQDLRIQAYVNFTEYGVTAIGDVTKLVDLVRELIVNEDLALSSLASVTRAIGLATDGLGVGLSIAGVVFDALEVGEAKDGLDKAVYGTQLGFDSATLLTTVGASAAGLVGASSVAAVLGGATVLLTGIGIGVGALVQAFGEIAERAEAVGAYFGDVNKAYHSGGYTYDANDKVLKPLFGAVIEEVDENGNVVYDSQYLYRTHHGSTGSGRIHYFFWAGDFPDVVRDKTQAINVREGIGAPKNDVLPNSTDYTTLVLPSTPKSYISYSWQTLPGATTRGDYGFDILRQLEQDERFDYDFYIFPSEYIVNSITHEYVSTIVTVKLTRRSICLQAPMLDASLQGYLQYALEGAGGEYVVGLAAGVSFSLSSSSGTRWVVDPQFLSDETIVVRGHILTVGGVELSVQDPKSTTVLIRTKNGEVLEVDFEHGTTVVVQEDASKYPGGGPALLAHLNDLKDPNQGSLVIVENYTTPSGEAVGRAYYDVEKKCFLFTSGAPHDLTEDAKPVAFGAQNDVWFSDSTATIWRVDIATGVCSAHYNGFYPSPNRELKRVWEEHGYVHAVFRHELRGGDEFGELGYILEADSMRLVSIVGGPELLSQLGASDEWDGELEGLLEDYVDNAAATSLADSLPGKSIKATIVADQGLVSVFGGESETDSSRYWIRLHDRVVIKSPPSPPKDIVFAGTILSSHGDQEEFCFYSPEKQTIQLQKKDDSTTAGSNTVVVPAEFGKLVQVLSVNGGLFVVTDAGYILRLTHDGALLLEAVTEEWFKQFPVRETSGSWRATLKDFAASHGTTAVSVLGLHDASSSDTPPPVVPAWLYGGRLIIGAKRFYGKQVGIAGMSADGRGAWLFDMDEGGQGHLYLQPLLEESAIDGIFAGSSPNDMTGAIPDADPLLEDQPFKSVAYTNNALHYSTPDGVVLRIASKTDITLYGVNQTWTQSRSSTVATLEHDLGELAKKWSHGDVVTLLGGSPGWYIVSAGKLLYSQSILRWEERPQWLGLGVDTGRLTGYVYLTALNAIYPVSGEQASTQNPDHVQMAIRSDNLLVLVPEPDAPSTTVVPIQGVQYVTVGQSWQLAGGGESAGYVCVIPDASWTHYTETTVEWRGAGTVRVDATAPGDMAHFVAKKAGDDLSIVDTRNARTLTIRKAYGSDPAYGKLKIRFEAINFEFIVEKVLKDQKTLQDDKKLDHLPDVTLQDIAGRQQSAQA